MPASGTYGATGLDPAHRSLDPLYDVLLGRPAWHADAACKEHPELDWFPTRGQDIKGLKAVCQGCLVADECAAAGFREHYGVWGGMSERERKRRRRSAA